ncbi:MAG: hypothetical protein ABIL61_08100 [candidate division WOR-3 bacterium]
MKKKRRKIKRDRELEELKQLYEKNIEAIRELRKLIEEDRKRAEEDRKRAEEYEKQREKEHKEAMERLTKLEETTRNLSKSISDLNDIWSDYTEKIILDGFENAAKEYGLEIIRPVVKPSSIKTKDGDNYEIDGLAVGRDFVIIIETKTTVRENSLKQLENNINRFLEFYPEYRNYKLYGAIAGIKISKDIKNLAEKKGFFVIEHKDGKDVRILNSKDFKPKDYSKL